MKYNYPETYLDCKPLLVALENLQTNAKAGTVGLVYNPYMSKFGWVLEKGSGLFGPRKKGIVIKIVHANWLKWPDRNKETEGGWKPPVALRKFVSKGKGSFWLAKATFPSGVHPMRFIEKEFPTIQKDITDHLTEFAESMLQPPNVVYNFIDRMCKRSCLVLKSATGGISNRLTSNWKHTVYFSRRK